MNRSQAPVEISDLQKLFADAGFSEVGVSNLKSPTTLPFYEDWLAAGFAGEMTFLKNHLENKRHPEQLLPQAHSVISLTQNYFPHPQPSSIPLSAARTALYAQGEDYHFWLKSKLNDLCATLQELFPEEHFRAFVDSAPVLERDYAEKAGLGWIGKNTCLIHPAKGSLFFIAEIFTSLKLVAETKVIPDRCGTCTRCIDVCPTQALVEPRKLDATKCISYLTIEAKSVAPTELRSKIGDWLFGCDLCQTICPWNQKIWRENLETSPQRELAEDREALIEDLRFILESSGKKIEKEFHGSALLRARPKGLKRNAIIVATNHQLVELKELIETFCSDKDLGELANWALSSLPS